MSNPVVVVKELTVRVVTGAPSEDPYGQGFSAIYAEVLVGNRAELDVLTEAKEHSGSVTVRCAMLDVTGRITKAEVEGQSGKFVVAVEDVTHRKQKYPWEDVVRVRRRPA